MKISKLILLALPLFTLPLMGSQCDSGVLFKEIGNELAAPISVAVDTAKKRAYVVNSNNNFEFTSTTFAVLDLTDPAAPVYLNIANNPFPAPNFSSQIYLDTAAGVVYTPNRESDNQDDFVDNLLRIHIDETSGNFGAIDSFTAGENPFGIACCDALGRIYVVNSGGDGDGTLDVYDPADLSTFTRLSLAVITDGHGDFDGQESTEVVLSGNRAFVSSRFGNIYVINTTEIGDTSKNPIDSLIFNDKDGDYRGLAVDGTNLYVADADRDIDALRVIDLTKIPEVTTDVATISEFDINDVQSAQIDLPEDGEPNEVAIFKGKAYISNLDDDTVSVVDLATNALVTNVAVEDEPFGITPFTIDGIDYVYVTNLRGNSISILDPDSNTILNTFKP